MNFEKLQFTNTDDGWLEAESSFGNFYIEYDPETKINSGESEVLMIEYSDISYATVSEQLQSQYHDFLKSLYDKKGKLKKISFKKVQGEKKYKCTNEVLDDIFDIEISFNEYFYGYTIESSSFEFDEIFDIDSEDISFETVMEAKEYFNNKFTELMSKVEQ